MNLVIIADSTCDLPKKFLDAHKIEILPLDLIIDGRMFEDNKDPASMIKFFSEEHIDKMHTAESKPFSVERFKQYFLEKIVPNFDYALVLTASKGRSKSYEHALEAANQVAREYRPIREKLGLKNNFSLRVVNSGTLFSGQGIVVAHVIDLLKSGMQKNELRRSVEAFKSQVYTYCVPKDLYYLRTRAKSKNDKSVGFLSAFIGKTLDINPIILGHMDDTKPVAKIKGHSNAVNKVFDVAIEQINAGLISKRVVISYAGNLNDLKAFESFRVLVKEANLHQVSIEISVMSIAGGINIGPGTLTVAFATGPHTISK